MLTKIKQFVFYLGYELSLFQKVSVGLLGLAVAGFLGMQATSLVADLSGSLLKGSVTDGMGEETRSGTVLSIMNVDQSGLVVNGTLSVKYALSNKPDASGKFTLTVSTDETEVGKTESESSEQAGVLTAQIEPANRTASSFTIRITADVGGQSLTDSVTVVSGASMPVGMPPPTSTGAIVPPPATPEPPPTPRPNPGTGSGTLPPGFGGTRTDIPVPPSTGSGTSMYPTNPQCTAIGRVCSVDADCCSQRCAQVNVGSAKVKVCLPKR